MALEIPVLADQSTLQSDPDLRSRKRPSRWAQDCTVGPMRFGLAYDTEALDRAFRLVHDQYVWRGYMKPHPSRRRIGLHQALPFNKIFVAQVATSVTGTVTLIEDSTIGLPMDEIYREELAAVREEARRIAEVSALAMDPHTRAQGMGIVMRLLRMLLLYAAEVARLDDLFLAVNPRHVEFYEKFFNCRPFATLKQYGKVNGAPAVALRLDLHFVRDLITETQTAGVPACERHEFLYGMQNYRDVMLQLRQDLPQARLTPDQFEYFFAEHEALTAAPLASQAFVRSFFPNRAPTRREAAAWALTGLQTFALAPALSAA